MRPISAAFASAVVQNHSRAVRVSSLIQRTDETFDVAMELTGEAGYVLDGTVDEARSRQVRRQCSMTVSNPGGIWTPGVIETFSFNQLIGIEDGIWINGSVEWVSLGIFLIDRTVGVLTDEDGTLQISGSDRMKLALFGKFRRPWTVAAGTPVADAIYAIAVDQGMGTQLYRLNDGGAVVGQTITFDYLTPRIDAMFQLANDNGLELYVDADGYLALAPGPTDTNLPDPAFAFVAGETAIHENVTKDTSDDRLRNAAVVRGESALHRTVIIAEARDLNPLSPVYNPYPPATGPAGDRSVDYSSALITDYDQALLVAQRLLLENGLVQEQYGLGTLVHPALEPGDVVRITDDELGTDDAFILDQVTIPFGDDSMALSTSKLRSFVG